MAQLTRDGITARVLGAKLIEARLERYLDRAQPTATERSLDLVGADLLERSANLAPILTGDLIKSARLQRLRRPNRFIRIVSYGTDHAVFAHEQITPAGPRGLGPLSSQKPATADGPVGGHFLSRPFRANAERYERFIAEGQTDGLDAAFKEI